MSDTHLPPAIFLMGPTASGKTDLAIALFKRLPVELISVDSALIYKSMDIGTAKPKPELLAEAPHFLVDILDPAQAYNAADFRSDALRLMAEITARGNIPLLVGGTMMYFKMLLDGMAMLPESDSVLRQKLLDEAVEHGWPHLHERLQQVDPVAAQRIKPMDSQRLQRALEVFELTGKPLSQWHEEQEVNVLPYNVISFAIAPQERSVLHERIAHRFHHMVEHGLVDEVKRLKDRGDLNLTMPSMRCVGYRQVWEYLDGLYDETTMIDKGIIATRQLAKRQLTWLRGWESVTWLDSLAVDVDAVEAMIRAHL